MPPALTYPQRMISRLGLIILAWAIITSHAAAPDIPFYQDRSEQFPAEGELAGATMKKVHVNKDGIVYVLTDRGMARLFGNKLALDHSFRPLNGKKILDSAMTGGEIFYLLEDALVCNGFAGSYAVKVPPNKFEHLYFDNEKLCALTPDSRIPILWSANTTNIVENGILKD